MYKIPNRIFVGGIPKDASQVELKDYFSHFGHVKDARIITDPRGISKGFGFVTYENENDATRALSVGEDELVFKENKLNIGHAFRKKTPMGGNGGGIGGGGGGGMGSFGGAPFGSASNHRSFNTMNALGGVGIGGGHGGFHNSHQQQPHHQQQYYQQQQQHSNNYPNQNYLDTQQMYQQPQQHHHQQQQQQHHHYSAGAGVNTAAATNMNSMNM